MADRDRAAVDVDARGIEAQLAHARDGLGGERLVELDQIQIGGGDAGARERLSRVAGIGPRPISFGSTPATADATKRASGRRARAETREPVGRRQQHAPPRRR